MKELLFTAVVTVTYLVFVTLLIAAGWMFIWKVFLKRFKFVQALLGISEAKDDSDANDRNNRSRGRTKKQRLD